MAQSLQYRTALRDLGVVLHVPAMMAVVSVPVAVAAGEPAGLVGFTMTAVGSLGTGQALFRRFRDAQAMTLRHAMLTVVLSWTIIPLFCVLPFVVMAFYPDAAKGAEHVTVFGNLWSASFESVSGFTSTGLTMVAHPSELPVSLQWWRTLMQWVGGVGVIVLMLTIFHPSGDTERLYFAEGHETSSGEHVVETARYVCWIFGAYTLAAVAALKVSGMTWWKAVNYGMTGIATGGFGITDRSLGDFGTAPRMVMIVVMIAGAVSFSVHYRVIAKRQWRLLWRAPENRALLVLLIVGALLVGLENRWAGLSATWLDAAFQVTSALTTAGFATADIATWAPGSLLLLALAMCCGGDAGATTGGLKLKRVLLLAKGAYVRVRGVALHPWRLMERKAIADESPESPRSRTLEAAAIMAVLWASTLLLGTLLLLHAAGPQARLAHVMLDTASALGNVGLSTGVASHELAWHGKLGLMMLMWLGRLEIIPVLVVVAALLRGRLGQNRS